MNHYFKFYVVLIFGASLSSAISEPMTAASAIALLIPTDHLSNPPGFMDPKASAQESKLEHFYAQQLSAIKYIKDNKITDAIPDLILYLNYSVCPGLLISA